MSNTDDIRDMKERLDKLMLELNWFANDLEKLLDQLDSEKES